MRFKPTTDNIINDYGMSNLVLIPKNSALQGGISSILNLKNDAIKIESFRGEDIPSILEDLYFKKKVKAVGITGDDLYDEYRIKNPNSLVELLETIDWNDASAMFRRPALCVIGRIGEEITQTPSVAVNRKYLETSKTGLEELGILPKISIYNGNTEATVASGINDLCVDIVYSGKTLNEYGLEIKEIIRFSDFSVIGVNEKSPLGLKRDYDMIFDRVKSPVEGSYTSKLSLDPNKAMKKLGEEFSEFARACTLYGLTGDVAKERKDVALEFQQLFYTMSINAARCDLDFSDISQSFYSSLKRD